MRRYSEAVKADVRRRMSPPHRQSVDVTPFTAPVLLRDGGSPGVNYVSGSRQLRRRVSSHPPAMAGGWAALALGRGWRVIDARSGL